MRGTPVRRILLPASSLQALVENGLGAMKKSHHEYIHVDLRPAFADSLDIDKAFEEGHEQENRWDYLLGYGPTASVIAVEPHSAKQKEISAVIKKQVCAKEQLAPQLTPNARIAAWFWVASGKVHIANTERAIRRLEQHGIKFVHKMLMRKDLPIPQADGRSRGQ
ncbi:MAG: hypothetical protein HY907_09530 [Deltaproteobacteria bacterium]|nr:hypothetical protein [Deltaproteobacteria bacterium]